ncbi:hypothetical protein O9G_005172, partial [Rozella allomycis CSF55]
QSAKNSLIVLDYKFKIVNKVPWSFFPYPTPRESTNVVNYVESRHSINVQTARHYNLDQKSIHEHICHYFNDIRGNNDVGIGQVYINAEDKIAQQESRKTLLKTILDICVTECQIMLYKEMFQEALPAALQALRCSMLLYGNDSIELVSSYLLLGQASVGMHTCSQQYLSLAQWAVIKSKAHDNYEIKAQIHHNFSLLYGANKKFDDALIHATKEVYYSSLIHGPDNILICTGYYQLGLVMLSMSKKVKAMRLFSLIVDMWEAYLKSDHQLGSAQKAEAIQMLKTIQKDSEEKDKLKYHIHETYLMDDR